MAAFALLVVGGSAYFMSQNLAVNYRSGASNVKETASGTLIKSGTPEFSGCEAPTTFALTGSDSGGCIPVSVKSDLADPFVDKEVLLTGTLQDGVFYATAVTSSEPAE
jgi:hypothetical protein